MKIQISSGQGPAECELAVGKLLRALLKEVPGIVVEEQVRGRYSDSFKSVIISGDDSLAGLEGTVQWICQSPYRPKHKRKNWFVDVSIIPSEKPLSYNEELVRFETFRSGGKGGQHVNKVETGVRAVYVPTGLSVVSTEARSQHMNKKAALNRLCALIAGQNCRQAEDLKKYNRLEHYRLERGNAVRIYSGIDFKRIK